MKVSISSISIPIMPRPRTLITANSSPSPSRPPSRPPSRQSNRTLCLEDLFINDTQPNNNLPNQNGGEILELGRISADESVDVDYGGESDNSILVLDSRGSNDPTVIDLVDDGEVGQVNAREDFSGAINVDINQAASSNSDTSAMADVEVIEVSSLSGSKTLIDLTESPEIKDMFVNNNAARKFKVSPPPIQCPICFESYPNLLENGLHLVSSKCGHIFCSNCLPQSLMIRKICPTCRMKLTSEDYHPLYLP